MSPIWRKKRRETDPRIPGTKKGREEKREKEKPFKGKGKRPCLKRLEGKKDRKKKRGRASCIKGKRKNSSWWKRVKKR